MPAEEFDPDQSSDIEALIVPFLSGDREAADRLLVHCHRKILGLAGKLVRRANLQGIYDAEDAANSGLFKLWHDAAAGKLSHIKRREEFWSLLSVIVKRKVLLARERLQSVKRGGPGSNSKVSGNTNGTGTVEPRPIVQAFRQIHIETVVDRLFDNSPAPEDVAIARSELERLVGLIEDPAARRIVMWKLEGHTNAEIAHRLNRSLTSIERKLRFIRLLWEESELTKPNHS